MLPCPGGQTRSPPRRERRIILHPKKYIVARLGPSLPWSTESFIQSSKSFRAFVYLVVRFILIIDLRLFSIWLQKCVVMCVIQQLLKGLEMYGILKIYWSTMALTFIASFVVCLVECKPFQLYWQVVPDPGIQYPRHQMG